MLVVNLSKGIGSVEVFGQSGDGGPTGHNTVSENVGVGTVDEAVQEAEEAMAALQSEYASACEALGIAVKEVTSLREELLTEYKYDIAELSVEIAKKIIGFKVNEGDYDLKEIVHAALGHAPAKQDVTVRLNPADLAIMEQMDGNGGTFGDVEFIADPQVGRAECVVETARGTVESRIEEHVGRVREALGMVE